MPSFEIPNPGEAYCFDVQTKEHFLVGQYEPEDYKVFELVGDGNIDLILLELKQAFSMLAFQGEIEFAEAIKRRARETRETAPSVV